MAYLDNGGLGGRSTTQCCRNRAIDQLYTDCFEQLVAYLRARFGPGPPEPEDVAQRAFGKLSDIKNLFEIVNKKAYLWRIACNIAISEKRTSKIRVKNNIETKTLFSYAEGYGPTPEQVLETKEQMALALSALRKMPGQRRRAFILTRIEGLTHSEASKRLGISRPAVSKHVARATADLYAVLMNQ